ncbi:MAG: 16S rRNA (guanine(966)-N(2))-methyltransferase RsmD [Pseudomonadota bacterium]
MRIVGGDNKGTAISAPKGEATRPTSERLRETIFNMLAHSINAELEDARVLDLFAGSGAMGLEALSRGAGFALFVENATAARGALRRNIDAVRAIGRTRVWRRDATRLGACPLPPFSLVFCDPPYGRNMGEKALQEAAEGGWVTPGAIAVLEERRGHLPGAINGWEALNHREAGESVIGFFRQVQPL